MRAHLLLIAVLVEIAGAVAARADGPAPLSNAAEALLQEERFSKRVNVLLWRGGYSVGIHNIDRPGDNALNADEIQQLVEALAGVPVAELTFNGDASRLPQLGSLRGVTKLYVTSGSGIDESLGKLLPQLPELERLTIADPQLGNLGLEGISKCEKLRYLNITHGKFDDEGIRHLRALRELKGLSVEGASQISDAVFPAIAELSQLGILRITSAKITGSELSRLSHLENLTELQLSHTRVTDEELHNLAGCESLRILRLDHTRITDGGIVELVALKGLRTLVVDATAVSDKAIPSLLKIPDLLEVQAIGAYITNAGRAELSRRGIHCTLTGPKGHGRDL